MAFSYIALIRLPVLVVSLHFLPGSYICCAFQTVPLSYYLNTINSFFKPFKLFTVSILDLQPLATFIDL